MLFMNSLLQQGPYAPFPENLAVANRGFLREGGSLLECVISFVKLRVSTPFHSLSARMYDPVSTGSVVSTQQVFV
jgi:hypothetical protein